MSNPNLFTVIKWSNNGAIKLTRGADIIEF